MICQNMLSGHSGAIVENNLWLCMDKIGLLARIDLDTRNVVSFFQIPENLLTEQAVGDCISNGEYLYLIPYNMELLYKFDVKKMRFEGIDVIKEHEKKKMKYKYGKSLTYNNKIVLFGQQGMENILVYDLEMGVVIAEIDYPSNKMNKRFEWINNFSDVAIIDNTCYINVVGMNAIMSVNLSDFSISYIYIDCKEFDNGIISLVDAGNGKLWIAGKEGDIGLWSPQTGVERLLVSGRGIPYEHIINSNNGIICIPLYETTIYKFDESGRCETAGVFYKNSNKIRWKFRFSGVFNNEIILQSGLDGSFYSIDINNLSVKMWECNASEDMEKEFMNYLLGTNKILNENESISLDKYIDILQR